MQLKIARKVGTWFVYAPASGATGDGVFGMNLRLRLTDVTDGTSNTLAGG